MMALLRLYTTKILPSCPGYGPQVNIVLCYITRHGTSLEVKKGCSLIVEHFTLELAGRGMTI